MDKREKGRGGWMERLGLTVLDFQPSMWAHSPRLKDGDVALPLTCSPKAPATPGAQREVEKVFTPQGWKGKRQQVFIWKRKKKKNTGYHLTFLWFCFRSFSFWNFCILCNLFWCISICVKLQTFFFSTLASGVSLFTRYMTCHQKTQMSKLHLASHHI